MCGLYSISFIGFDKKSRTSETRAARRWQIVILPILKTHILKTEHFPEKYFLWEKDVMSYIESEGIENREDVDLHRMAKEVFQGQTALSLTKFFSNLKGISRYPGEPLSHVCSRCLDNYERKKRKPRKTFIDNIKKIVQFYEIHKR